MAYKICDQLRNQRTRVSYRRTLVALTDCRLASMSLLTGSSVLFILILWIAKAVILAAPEASKNAASQELPTPA